MAGRKMIMLTKTLKFDDDVLEVLRSMDWQDGGKLGIITGGQLERSLYVRTNKAFDALSGKWNRKAGGIVFSVDPRPQFEAVIENGTLEVERDGFFETPRQVVERMIELVPVDKVNNSILEPSAGLGAIVKSLIAYGVRPNSIWCVEKNSDRALKLRDFVGDVFCCDFLIWNAPQKFDRIYMNPPFEELQDIDHVTHAYNLLAHGGKMVSVMAESAFFRQDRKSTDFRLWLSNINAHIENLPEGSFKESGTGVNARLVVIEKDA
jgi:hypothetical protein